MSNIAHYNEFVRRYGYHETLSDPQRIDCYAKAYPGRINPLIEELLGDRDRQQALDEGAASFYFYKFPEIVAWVENGVEPSPILSAILRSDLGEAVKHADAKTRHHLCDIVEHLLLWLPADCQGSEDAYNQWKTRHEMRVICLNELKGWEEWKRQMSRKA